MGKSQAKPNQRKRNALLTVDLGNTSISLGVVKGRRVVEVHCVDSTLKLSELRTTIRKTLRRIQRKHKDIQGSILCSVVPKLTPVVKNLIQRELRLHTKIIGKDVKVPIKNKYRNPKQVGQDRLVGAYAAKAAYGTPVIVIDLGTAITFDVVSKKGDYEGGIIIPGIRLSIESLFSKTAMLPNIKNIKVPRNLIGRETTESILSGIFYGYGSMCKGLIQSIEKKLKSAPKIVLTGGYANQMKTYIGRKSVKIDQNLVFQGMALLWPCTERSYLPAGRQGPLPRKFYL